MELGEIRRGTSHTLEVPVAEVNRTWLSGCTKIEMTLSPSTRLKTWTLEGTYSDVGSHDFGPYYGKRRGFKIINIEDQQ